MSIGKRLVQRKIRKREATQRRLQVIAGIDSDRAVRDIDAVSAHPSAQRKQWCGSVTKNARLSAVVFVKIHIAHPQQGLRRGVAWMLGGLKAGMHVDGVIVFVVIRKRVEKVQLL